MRACRAVWLLLVVVVSAAGVLYAALVLPPAALVVLTIAGVGLSRALQPTLAHRRLTRGRTSGAWTPPLPTTVPVLTVGWLAVTGLTAALGASGPAALGLLVVAGWPLHRARRHVPAQDGSTAHPPHAAPGQAGGPTGPMADAAEQDQDQDRDRDTLLAAVPSWSDERLCSAWQASFNRVRRAGTPKALAYAAAERNVYLDEIERRHAPGFAAWLADGARAASDPRRYLGYARRQSG